MLHLHKKLGVYLQFGGHIELLETPWQAVVHELKEESGYDISQLQVLQPKIRVKHLSDATIHPQPASHSTHPFGQDNNHFHTDIAYAVITSQEPAHAPDDGESTTIKLFTRDELIALSPDEIPENVREIAKFMFDECLSHWEPVAPDRFIA